MPFPTERFLETVGLFPFLYDKTQPDYLDKDAKNNRWEMIGSEFGITGVEAMGKFRNARDRWLKILAKMDNACRSGAGGDAGKGLKSWALFGIVDGMLRGTPHYAEKIITNIPADEQRYALFMLFWLLFFRNTPQPSSSGDSTLTRSPVLQEREDWTLHDDDDDGRWVLFAIFASTVRLHADHSFYRQTMQTNLPSGASAAPPRPAKKAAHGAPPSRRKKQRCEDNFDQAIRDVLGTCSSTLNNIQKKNEQKQVPPGDDCVEGANWIVAKLRVLTPQKRCEVMYEINTLLYNAEMESFK
ncbi:unnamed protein product [Ixodes pacificus]